MFCLALIIFAIWLFLSDKIYPQIFIAQSNIAFKTYPQAKDKLDQTISERLSKTLQFTYQGASRSAAPEKFEITVSPDEIQTDTQKAINDAFEYGHRRTYSNRVNIPLQISFNQSFEHKIQKMAQSIYREPLDSQIKVESDQIVVTPSEEGLELDETDLKEKISNYINTGIQPDLSIKTKKVPPKLSYETALKIKKRLDNIKLQPLKLTFKDQTFEIKLEQVISFIDIEGSEMSLASFRLFDQPVNISSFGIGTEEIVDTKLALDVKKTSDYFGQIALQIDQEVKEPLFSIEQTEDPQKPKIKEFQPPTEGRKLNIDSARERLANALLNPDIQSFQLPVDIKSPKNSLANDYGVKELIGRGISNFTGSITNRIFNLQLAASRINGVLISPDEEFSFVNTVGDISAATGYKQAYVIKSGRTVLDDGGGVCQVSTTIFRAALNTGLPITERTAHAYRVGYYEQGYPPGLDATIFHPTVDFKFKNDTGRHILIQSYVVGSSLYVDLYGTGDGRIATVSKPIITSQTPPLPELRQDDPTLPKGTVKQVDWAASGANVVFTRTVTRGGEQIINETFKSNYRPWQAVYLVGTKEG